MKIVRVLNTGLKFDGRVLSQINYFSDVTDMYTEILVLPKQKKTPR